MRRGARFALSRTALSPVWAGDADVTLRTALSQGGPALESLIIGEHLAPLWHDVTRHAPFADTRRRAASAYLRQQVAIEELHALFEQAGIRYAVTKGAASRERTHQHPSLRVCGDIDVLVAPDQRLAAVRSLVDAGYHPHLNADNVSHEITVSKGRLAIDLHWDILRPGRTRVGVVDGMLSRRVTHNGWWRLSDADMLFLMLVHGAVSKHVSRSGLGLHRVADVSMWWQRCPQPDVQWREVYQLLDACGLKTAAWTMLTWVRMLTGGSRVDAGLVDAIASVRPGRVRSRYLATWLAHDLPDRLTHHHALRLIFFSLFLHDTPADAWHALRGWRRATRSSPDDLSALAARAQAG
jgi:hypothetical protein